MIKKTILMLLVLAGGVVSANADNTYTIKFINSRGWTKPCAHYWDSDNSSTNTTTWPGTEMSLESTTTINGVTCGIYSITVNLSYTPNKVIFSDDGLNQLPEETFTNNKTYGYTSANLFLPNSRNNWNGSDSDVESVGIFNNIGEEVYEFIINSDYIDGNDFYFRLKFSDYNDQIRPNNSTSDFTYTFSDNGKWETHRAGHSGYFGSTGSFKIAKSIGASQYKINVYAKKGTEYYVKAEIVSMPVSIKDAGYGTFSCDRALDFTNCDVTPYVATGYSDGKVTMEKVTKVSANTGLFLKGTPGTALNSTISVIENDAEGRYSGDNLLKHGTGDIVKSDGDKYRYVFQTSDLCFKKLSTTGATVPKGKAYLELPANTGAPSLSIELDGETTGIKVINFEEENTQNDGQMFDLQGRRVAEPTKGVYIVNGKKVIIK